MRFLCPPCVLPRVQCSFVSGGELSRATDLDYVSPLSAPFAQTVSRTQVSWSSSTFNIRSRIGPLDGLVYSEQTTAANRPCRFCFQGLNPLARMFAVSTFSVKSNQHVAIPQPALFTPTLPRVHLTARCRQLIFAHGEVL